MNSSQFIGAVELGLIYAIVGLGIYLSFRVIQFSDLTADGSLTLGAAVCAIALTKGLGISMALILSILSSALAGVITGILNTRFKIMDLLSGILVMTALYSINLRVMGRPNIPLFGERTLLDGAYNMAILSGAVGIISLFIICLLKTEWGLAVRSIGNSPRMSKACGVNVQKQTMWILGLSNGLIGLAGALLVQLQGFADISMGTGTVVIGFATVILGEKLMRTQGIIAGILGCILGAALFRVAIAFGLNATQLGLKSSDLNLITSGLVIAVMVLPRHLKNNKSKI